MYTSRYDSSIENDRSMIPFLMVWPLTVPATLAASLTKVVAPERSTESALLIAVICFTFGKPEFLDIALVYALINFVGTIAVLKFFRYGSLGAAETGQQDG